MAIILVFSTKGFTKIIEQYSPTNFLGELTLSKSELREGRIIQDIQTSIRRGKIPKFISKPQIEKLTLFKELFPILNKMTLLGKSNTFTKNDLLECIEIKKDATLAPSQLARNIQKRIISYCSKQFLTNSKSNLSEDEQMNFISNYLVIFNSKKNIEYFRTWISKIRNNKTLFSRISAEIWLSYQKKKISPKEDILSSIELMEGNISSFKTQTIDLKNSKSLFTVEIKSIFSRFEDAFDKKDFPIAEKTLNRALKFFIQNKNYIEKNYFTRRFNGSIRNLISSHTGQSTNKMLETLFKHTTGEEREITAFNIIYCSFFKNDNKNALNSVRKLELDKNFNTFDNQLKFWIAYTFKKNGLIKEANQYYKKIIEKETLSYYSILSQKEIDYLSHNEIKANLEVQVKTPMSLNEFNELMANNEFLNYIKRILVWNNLKLDYYVRMDLNLLLTQLKNSLSKIDLPSEKKNKISETIILELAQQFNKNKSYLHTFRLLHESITRNLININGQNIKLLFPFEYLAEISKIDEEMDPVLVLALIRQESAFNPKAKSNAGASGLMQIMPATARTVASREKSRQLNDPNINLKIGIKYLKKLIDKFEGNLIYSLSAYNAGEGNLNRWIGQLLVAENPLLVIEAIPFQETRTYVKLIYRNIFYYRFLTETAPLQVPLEDSFKVTLISKEHKN